MRIGRTEKTLKRFLSIFLLIFVLAAGFSFPVSGEPTDAFTHVELENRTKKSIPAREMYRSVKVITATTLGLEESLLGLNDLCCDQSNHIYLLLAERSKIVKLNADYSYNRTIEITDQSGEAVSFHGAQGIFVDDSGDIYICDSENERVIAADENGRQKLVLPCPDSDLLPENFFYQPYRLVRDNKGYTYVLSLGCYYGALSYSPEGEFLGFYGANNVKASALDTLSFLWDKLTRTDTKKSFSVKTLPFSFVDLALDHEGYMVTCTGKTDTGDNGTGQIRKLSPGGGDILYKRDTDGSSAVSQSLNFLETKVLQKNYQKNPQNIIAVDTDANDFIYALEQTYGLVYIYDSECNMLGGFGGNGGGSVIQGVFSKPTSLKLLGDSVLVTDYQNQSVTVFEITDYGKALKKAQAAYIRGNYENSKPLWDEVLSYNRGNQLAYRGLAMAALTEEDYEEALDYAKKGLDYATYDMAWQILLTRKVRQNFVWIFLLAFLLIGGAVAFAVIVKKRKVVLIGNIKVKTALFSPIHPFQSFEDIKYKKQGSVLFAAFLLFLLFFGQVLENTASGFLFIKNSPRTYNMLYTFVGSVGIILLWSLANWLVSCLAAGKGTWKEVFIATVYALIPLIVYTFVRVLLSQFLSLSGLAVLDGVKTAILIFTFFLLAIAMMAIHEYDFFKFLFTSFVSVLLMILIVFIVILLGLLSQQIVEFFRSLWTEAFFR